MQNLKDKVLICGNHKGQKTCCYMGILINQMFVAKEEWITDVCSMEYSTKTLCGKKQISPPSVPSDRIVTQMLSQYIIDKNY
jgi:hypothetical protein